ncbi:MAG: 23S rRNA (pseudouridine(1915)-N(3))-methyltransferase RlmH [Chitinophagia bacterium]|nr:23S rRNA (pseudouridine(1915)-N(3))-methyltransferase RlmH [Chitinophagia bacterium]
MVEILSFAKNLFKKQPVNIEIWSLGKESDGHIAQGTALYFQKTAPWVTVQLVVLSLPKKMATTDVARTKLAEEELILKRLTAQHYLLVLDERGKLLTSPQWAQTMQQCMNQGVKTLVLLIGGAFGVTDAVRQRANLCVSLSPLVFPHQLVRLIVAEQVYRAFSILNNSPYHHE